MEKREYLNQLFDLYKSLFTDKQIFYFEKYYFDDLSIIEISEINNVSKAYVSKVLITVEKELLRYEESLKLLKLKEELKSLLSCSEKEIKEKLEKLL